MKKLSAGIFVLAVVLAAIGAVAAERVLPDSPSPENAFYRAKEFYEKGDFTRAVLENESIIAAGSRSGNVYYNLGNAYFKKGDLGKAILNYERARLYIPSDSDLLANCRYARSMMKRPDPPEKRFRIFGKLDRAFDYLTMGQGVALAEALYYFLIFYVIVTKVLGRFSRYSTLFIMVLSMMLILAIIPLVHKAEWLNKGAIVTAAITDARYEPAADATVHFPLYDGMKIKVLRLKGSWCKVKRLDGQIGWVEKGAIGLIKTEL
jgi:tetratricopeptide (TPR) repeat protein